MKGGTNKPTDVTYITFPDATSTFYQSLDEAKVKPATEIFVERLVAKVTVQGTSGTVANNNIVQTGADGTSSISTEALKWKVLGWKLDITNRKSHFVRNTIDHATWDALSTNDASVTAPYRFIGSATVKSGMDTPSTVHTGPRIPTTIPTPTTTSTDSRLATSSTTVPSATTIRSTA